MVETHFLLENLWISESSLGILEKFQCSSALPNIRYNCAVIILESIVLGIYLWFKIYFLIDTNAKMWTEIIDLVILGRNYWQFLQGGEERIFLRRSSQCETPMMRVRLEGHKNPFMNMH